MATDLTTVHSFETKIFYHSKQIYIILKLLMENYFNEKKAQTERVDKFQKEIEKLLIERPELIPLQREIEIKLDKIGKIDSPEGRSNRAALAFALLREAFVEFKKGMVDYSEALSHPTLPKKKIGLHIIR